MVQTIKAYKYMKTTLKAYKSLNAKYHLHVQQLTNAHDKYASKNKILLGHKSESI